MTTRLEAFAVAAPGLSELLAAELGGLGIEASKVEPAGVAFTGSMREVMAANLWSRIATRIVVRIAEFRATSFAQLEKQALRVKWESWLPATGAVSLRVTCKKSRLYHSDAVAERIERALGRSAERDEVDDEERESNTAQLVIVRIFRDVVTISLDSSGALLHRRGYRQAIGKGPLRETIAAAMLAAAGWRGAIPLWDPFCGSGTIAIEAAQIARQIAPGLGRSFAFERWPCFVSESWEALKQEARSRARASAESPILASDRDAGAIENAIANARRAGVERDISFRVAPLSSGVPTVGDAGLVLTNPPYGHRVSEGRELRDLYASLGAVLRDRLPGWGLGLLAADTRLVAQVKLPLRVVLSGSNGGIPVQLYLAPSLSERQH